MDRIATPPRRVSETMVGPIQEDADGFFFELMSIQGGVIRLDYANKMQAMQARKVLGAPITAHRVDSIRLFRAMRRFLQEVEEKNHD